MKIKIGIALSVLVVVGLVYDIVGGIKSYYQYQSTIGSYWDLADRSSTLTAKSEYIDKFVAVLAQQHFEGKYNALFFKTPVSSFDQNYEVLKTLQTRLHQIAAMDPASFQYQTAIQQITAQEQGEAGEMLEVFGGVWQKENYPLLWEWVVPTNITILLVMLIGSLLITGNGYNDRRYGY